MEERKRRDMNMSESGERNADESQELAIGDPAPDFRLPASTGGEIALSASRGTAHVVLFFVRAYG
jgi:hypothetical protein